MQGIRDAIEAGTLDELADAFYAAQRRAILMSEAPQSPRISICALDQNDVQGCWPGDEIVDWFTANDARKREILEASERRRKESGFTPL